ncbi:MAG: tetratricopeptide repeat protein, partial [Candidatus Methylacidiphilales bacterium]
MKKKPYPTSTSSLRILQASASGVRCFCLLGAVVLTSGPGSGFTSLAHAQERKDKETAPGVWPQVPQSPMTRPHPVADPGSAPAAIPVDGDVSKPAPAGDAGSAAVPAEPVAPFSPNGSIQVTRPADAQFERAMMLLNNKNWAAAINEFNNFIRGYPRHGKREEALYRIAEAYREINRPADAMLAFEYLIQTFPNSVFTPAAQLRLGHMYYLKGTYDKAVALLTPALKGDASVRVPARYLLGLTLLNMGKYEDGRVVLLELINATPPSDYAAHAAQALAERSEKDGKMEQALIYWRRTLKLSDNKVLQATCTARGGWVAINLANFKDAETLFRTCLELDPGTDWVKVANSGLLRVYSKTKRYADLLELADPSKENFADKFLPSSLAELLFNLGNASYNLQKYASAVVFYDRYLQEFPKQEGAQAAAYQRLMSHRELEPDSLPTRGAEFLEGWPDSPLVPTVQMLLADYFNRKNEYEKALPYWEKLAEKIPADLQKNAESI